MLHFYRHFTVYYAGSPGIFAEINTVIGMSAVGKKKPTGTRVSQLVFLLFMFVLGSSQNSGHLPHLKLAMTKSTG